MNDAVGAVIPGPLRLSQPPPLPPEFSLDATNDSAGWPTRAAADALAEDDARRAAAVLHLVGGAEPQARIPGRGAHAAPAVLVQFWDTPGDVPRDVAACVASWDRLMDDVPGLARVMFDDDTARQFIRDELSAEHAAVFNACRHPAMRCDYFRLCFLLQHGGLYVDADEVYLGGLGPDLLAGRDLKVQPLCYDVAADEMVAASAFVEAARAKSRREPPDAENTSGPHTWTHYVNNNPLVASAGHPVIQAALERATRLLQREAVDGGLSLDVQSTTGPGNLTAALIAHALKLGATGHRAKVLFMENWDAVSLSRWPLDYRRDERNWRLWNSNL